MTLLGLISILLTFFLLLLSFLKPRLTLLILLATLFTRSSNLIGIPRFFSPTFIEVLILFIIVFKLKDYIFRYNIFRYSFFLLFWCLLHIVLRQLQFLHYPDASFNITSSEIINIYLKIYLLFLAIFGYLSYTKKIMPIITVLSINLLFLLGFTYYEFFTGITHAKLLNTTQLQQSTGIHITLYRYGQRLIHGPLGHWVATGTVLVTYLSVAMFNNKLSNFKKNFFIILVLLTIFLVGARAQFLAAAIVVLLYYLINFKKNIATIAVLLIIFLTFGLAKSSERFNYYFHSFTLDTDNKMAENLKARIDNSIYLTKHLTSIPLIGYGFFPRRNSPSFIMPISQYDMEVNFFLYEAFDFGLISLIITIIFFASSLIYNKRGTKKYSYSGFLSWIALLICMLSNGLTIYHFYIIPIIFLAYSHWNIIQNKQKIF